MPANTSNKALLDDGFRLMAEIIKKHVMANLEFMAEHLPAQASEAYRNQTYGDPSAQGPMMTGNTATGYGAGTYVKGTLQHLCLAQRGMRNPVNVKLDAGEIFEAGRTRYDGTVQEHNYEAQVATDKRFSADFVRDFVSSHKPPTEKFALRLATGTEYSTYMQNVREIDVLTGFFNEFGDIVRQQWYWKKLK